MAVQSQILKQSHVFGKLPGERLSIENLSHGLESVESPGWPLLLLVRLLPVSHEDCDRLPPAAAVCVRPPPVVQRPPVVPHQRGLVDHALAKQRARLVPHHVMRQVGAAI